jgi:hypothetical protein
MKQEGFLGSRLERGRERERVVESQDYILFLLMDLKRNEIKKEDFFLA